MIEHVYRRAAAARGVDAVVVATDDPRIAAAIEGVGGIVRMTRGEHRSGTDRLAEVAADLDCEIVLNVQGDEPLIDPATVEAVIAPLVEDPWLDMSTACTPLPHAADYDNPNVVKVVINLAGNALYFSRSPLPHVRGPAKAGPHDSTHVGSGVGSGVGADFTHVGSGFTHVGAGFSRPMIYKHLGIYGYRRTFLQTFAALAPTPLELAESLEQLRALEHGYRIRTVVTQFDSIGVDTPEDLERVRHQLAARA